MGKPLVYIILINYNGYKDTIECVNSIRKISYPNYKIIVVDNKSTDNSVNEIANRCTVDKLIVANKNLGFAGGNNLGIGYALEKGADAVVLLNNDTVVDKNFLNKSIKTIYESNEIGILIGKILFYKNRNLIWYAGGEIIKSKGNSMHYGYNKESYLEEYNKRKNISFATGCYMFIKREVIEKVGNMSEKYFLYYEDTDYCNKVTKAGYKLIYEPEVIIYHKVSSSSNKVSDLMQYYISRNRLLFIKDNINGSIKIKAYMNCYLDFIKDIIRKRGKFKNYKKGCLDFYRCNWGMKE